MADLSRMADVEAPAKAVAEKHARLDVLINNAGVYNAPDTVTQDGLDVRFAVNTIAPYLLTRRLLPLLGTSGRVVNLSSATQSPVDPQALAGQVSLSDGAAYAQSKLALTIWSRSLALSFEDNGPVINDRAQFASPHPDALDSRKSREIVRAIETVLVDWIPAGASGAVDRDRRHER